MHAFLECLSVFLVIRVMINLPGIHDKLIALRICHFVDVWFNSSTWVIRFVTLVWLWPITVNRVCNWPHSSRRNSAHRQLRHVLLGVLCLHRCNNCWLSSDSSIAADAILLVWIVSWPTMWRINSIILWLLSVGWLSVSTALHGFLCWVLACHWRRMLHSSCKWLPSDSILARHRRRCSFRTWSVGTIVWAHWRWSKVWLSVGWRVIIIDKPTTWHLISMRIHAQVPHIIRIHSASWIIAYIAWVSEASCTLAGWASCWSMAYSIPSIWWNISPSSSTWSSNWWT